MNKDLLLKMSNSTSVEDLMKLVKVHGLNTEMECINKMADIIGCKTVSELTVAAESDKHTFFFMLKYVWSIPELIEFYNTNCNKVLTALKEEVAENVCKVDSLQVQLKESKNTSAALLEGNKRLALQVESIGEYSRKVEMLDYEVLQLKAKLYDLRK